MDEKLPVVNLEKVHNVNIIFGADPAFDGAIAVAYVKSRTVEVLFSQKDLDHREFIDTLIDNLFSEYPTKYLLPGGESDASHPTLSDHSKDGI